MFHTRITPSADSFFDKTVEAIGWESTETSCFTDTKKDIVQQELWQTKQRHRPSLFSNEHYKGTIYPYICKADERHKA